MPLTCIICSKPLSGRQRKFCCDNHQKRDSKKKHRVKYPDRWKIWRKEYSRINKQPYSTRVQRLKLIETLGGRCLRCETIDQLEIHHIKPPKVGGQNSLANLTILCISCHQAWHKIFDDSFWKLKK